MTNNEIFTEHLPSISGLDPFFHRKAKENPKSLRVIKLFGKIWFFSRDQSININLHENGVLVEGSHRAIQSFEMKRWHHSPSMTSSSPVCYHDIILWVRDPLPACEDFFYHHVGQMCWIIHECLPRMRQTHVCAAGLGAVTSLCWYSAVKCLMHSIMRKCGSGVTWPTNKWRHRCNKSTVRVFKTNSFGHSVKSSEF